ncbi:TPA: calcium-translocating P-type ATPase, PMCA-type [bacterium]|nr:calcium-translocating P-type ATPase, PMCA-type [bacterium]
MNQWWKLNIDQVLTELKTDIAKGLLPEEVKIRLEKYGLNELEEKKKKTIPAMLFDQFKDFMIIVLIAAAIVSGAIGELSDSIAILVIVIINAIIGFVQEYRAEKAMSALKSMASPTAIVIRDGLTTNIPASDIVPGDIVILEAGNIVPADIRLTEIANLKVEEAALTGESMPVEKNIETLQDENLSLGDRKNMVYKGTIVTYGRGQGIVTETGMKTELGKIASMLQNEEETKTPLQKRLTKFSQKLAIAILAICVIVFVFGIMRGEPIILMLLTSISLAVAAIPEALPAVITITLALSAKNMVRQNALIRTLHAVETLGSVTYICSDKTGTLTLNKMTCEEVYVNDQLLYTKDLNREQSHKDLYIDLLLKSLALSNDVQINSEGNVIGDPTEIALYNTANDSGFNKRELEQEFPRVAEIPFDSERKCMTTFHKWNNGFISFTKGALDNLILMSKNILIDGKIKSIDTEQILKVNDRMASDGLRVLCIAFKEWNEIPDNIQPENVEANLTILGFVGMMDPPREEAKEAVALCKSAGIKTVMITGDHPITAKTIAKRLGILEDNNSHAIITGRELEEMSMEAFEEIVEDVRVYARVAPEQKLKIVKALQDKGHFVAMTGDGVNDAPALKKAEIGVAMGITGTDVSKEASSMILLDDNFATIVRAVKSGRRVFDNIRKFIRYTMSSNSGEIWTIFLAPFFGLPIALLPIHILWINLVTDGLPGLALAAEPAEKDVLSRPPRHPKESIFAHGLGAYTIWVGLLMGVLCLFTQFFAIKILDTGDWQTMVFTVLCLSQMGNVLSIRSEKESLFKLGLLTNKPLLWAFLLTFVLQMATIYIPFLNPIFKTQPLTFFELIFALGVSSIVFIAAEIEKKIRSLKVK